MRTYAEMIASGDVLLTDGANATRLRLETVLVLDPVLDVAGLASDGRAHALGLYLASTSPSLPPLDCRSSWTR